MKLRVLLALLFTVPLFTLLAEKEEQEPKAPENLPEPRPFSSLQINTKAENDFSSDVTPAPDTTRSNRRMPTSEELEKVRKDRNWMVEGMKDKQSAAKDAPTPNSSSPQSPANMDMSQSIIDMVLNKNKKPAKPEPAKELKPLELTPAGPDNTARTNAQTGSQSPIAFKPVISTNSFDSQNAVRPPAESNPLSAVLQQERTNARNAGFKESRGNPASLDVLANPFANLPIPEDALPQTQPRTVQAPATGMPPAGSPMLPNLAPTAPTMSGNMVSAAGPGNPTNGNLSPAVVPLDAGAPAPRFAVEQPYTILREQELVRQLQQQTNNNRPKVQELRSLVRDPNEARLF